MMATNGGKTSPKDSSIKLTVNQLNKNAKRKKDDGWSGEGWHGYMKEKERKLEEQFQNLNQIESEQKKSDIFNGVCIFVNGYTNPSSDHLKQIMADHGGRYQHYYSRRACTHIIATNLPDSKVKELKNEKVVHPDWILKSVDARRRLPIEPYRLYYNQKNAKAFACFRTKQSDDRVDEAENSGGESKANNFEGLLTTVTGESPVEESTERDKNFETDMGNLPSENVASDVKGSFMVIERHVEEKSTGTEENVTSIVQDADEILGTMDEDTGDSINDSGSDDFNTCIADIQKRAGIADAEVSSESMTVKHGQQRNENITDKIPNLTKHDYSNTSPSKSMGKAGDPTFLSDFYSNSRLHHLSMWRSELKRYATMIHKAAADKKHLKTLKKKGERCIMHIDLDSFFVSVALKEKPELKGKPVAVCHASKGAASSTNINSMSEIASCSYEARSKGVRNGMFLGSAREKCPDLVCVPYYFESYRTVSQKFYEILVSYTSEIEAVSCDEALLDVTDLITDGMTALDLAAKIRASIFKATDCKASAGIASNILLARMATRRAKPDGQFHLQKEDILDFVGNQKVSDLPGVGHSMHSKLLAMGINTCADLKLVPLQKLREKFGPKTGQTLYNNSRGRDDREIKTDHERQSVSSEVNYGIRFTESHESHSFLLELAKEVQERLRAIEMRGSHVTLKLMVRKKGAPEPLKHMGHGICDNTSKSTTISQPTDDANVIGKETISLLQQMNVNASDIRGMGIQVAKLVNAKTVSKTLKTINFNRGKQTASSFQDRPVGNIEPTFEKDKCTSERTGTADNNRMKMASKGKSSPKKRGRKPKQSAKIGGLQNFVTRIPIQDGSKSLFERNIQTTPKDPPLPSLDMSPQKQDISRGASSYELPPVSEVDPSVFYELPEDVRKSIVDAYKQRSQVLDVEPCCSKMLPANNEVENSNCFIVLDERINECEPQLTNLECVNIVTKEPSFAILTNDHDTGEASTNTNCLVYDPVVSNACENLDRVRTNSPTDVNLNLDAYPRVARETVSMHDDNGHGHFDYYPGALTLSNIDPDVMKALPEHLRREIMRDIKSQEKRIQRNKQKMKGNGSGMGEPKQKNIQEGTELQQVELQTGTKKKLAQKQQRTLSGHFNAKAKEAEGTDENVISEIRDGKSNTSAPINEIEDAANVVQDNLDEFQDGRHCVPKMQLPSLDGLTDHQDVKQSLKAWIASTDEPFAEDVEEFTKYIEDLLDCQCMEQAFLLLRLLKRSSVKSDVWIASWESINDRAQHVVENRYGGTLML